MSGSRRTACDTETDGKISTVHMGKRLYFCEQECLDEFLENPRTFLDSTHFKLTFELLEDAAD